MSGFTLILTCDYEVFGDGSGDVRTCMISPSQRMMDVCERRGTRMTFFVDICELWAFQQEESKGSFSDGYRPASLIREQLVNMVERGHDVQLHMHPQWLEYEFVSDFSWKLNLDHWRLPAYISQWPDEERAVRLTGLFERGRNDLENLLRPVDDNYRCTAFRAGAWCIQPEMDILESLRKSGFKFDSSVAPGVLRKDDLYEVDFSEVPPGTGPYPIDDSVVKSTSRSDFMVELPIATAKTAIGSRIFWAMAGLRSGLSNNACACIGQPAYKNTNQGGFLNKLVGLINNDIEMLDFCGKATTGKMMSILSRHMKNAAGRGQVQGPIIAIGHPKNFGNDAEFDQFLEKVSSTAGISLESILARPVWR